MLLGVCTTSEHEYDFKLIHLRNADLTLSGKAIHKCTMNYHCQCYL